jgi:glycine cleavage system transcriptional repressor
VKNRDNQLMAHLALFAIGRDRPGIVAAVSEALLEYEGNVEDSTMSILRGHFTMMLIVSVPETADVDRLRQRLGEVQERLDLEAVTLSTIGEVHAADEAASHILSVYGVDHPGILHAVSSVLAEREVSITDLTTRVLEGEKGTPVYAMMLEVAVPKAAAVGPLEDELEQVCRKQGVELSFRELERDVL